MNSSIKKRLDEIAHKVKPEERPKMILEWGDILTGDPVKDAEIRANRPTHDEDGNPIIYLEWPDDPI